MRGARGRVIAADIEAPVDLPPFDNSAVDGYAVRHADLERQGGNQAHDRRPPDRRHGARMSRSKRGEAIRIFTGAPMPAGADTVFMQEDVRVEGDRVIVPTGLKRGANRRLAGEDARQARSCCRPARCLRRSTSRSPPRSASPNSKCGGGSRSRCFRPATRSSSPARPRSGAAIYDANRYLLAGLLERLGAEVTDLGILADDPAELARALGRPPRGHDLVVTSGGVSTGEADHVRSAVERIGSLVFWRVAIKPGRPVAMGVIRGAPITTARLSSACRAIRSRCS